MASESTETASERQHRDYNNNNSNSNMKFAAVVVLFALAAGVDSSVLPLPWTLPAAPVPWTLPAAPLPLIAAGTHVLPPPAAVAVHAVHPAHAALQVSPVHVVSEAIVVPHPVLAVAPLDGAYVAKTRGSVHVAPLPGHANSVAAYNLQPADGTL